MHLKTLKFVLNRISNNKFKLGLFGSGPFPNQFRIWKSRMVPLTRARLITKRAWLASTQKQNELFSSEP
ncbi:hypothetical protein HanXRQr2_Chr13g0595241 [Helianthus annuus]|uniref:Uncharacterized protein n=1 Tax=Helianthus annuus TaxID=4232 RepID=A0A9K3EIR8_HELAN|nr:hypothetical protein HanXRQr2_Chr13g0595241 [Helianthus annuus]KAJ0849821.1 hypothetical protein HanPSC8_Chr13g0573351 [Helianthus annuus]